MEEVEGEAAPDRPLISAPSLPAPPPRVAP